jgi:tRNA pseudouridine55 synthase
MQRPPAFSALKVRGQRAYALARRGKEVTLKPRPVSIRRLEIVKYVYPELVLDVTCSSGTYIRSLGRDIGEALGSAAVMSQLRRTAVGPFTIERSCAMSEVNRETIANLLLPAVMAVAHLPPMTLSATQIDELGFGRAIAGSLPPGADLVAAVDGAGRLVALLQKARHGGLKSYRYFGPAA